MYIYIYVCIARYPIYQYYRYVYIYIYLFNSIPCIIYSLLNSTKGTYHILYIPYIFHYTIYHVPIPYIFGQLYTMYYLLPFEFNSRRLPDTIYIFIIYIALHYVPYADTIYIYMYLFNCIPCILYSLLNSTQGANQIVYIPYILHYTIYHIPYHTYLINSIPCITYFLLNSTQGA